MIKDENTGYSNTIVFNNPNRVKSKQYHGAGLQLGKIGNDKLKPIVVLSNTSDDEVTVTVKVPYTKENGNHKKVVLDKIILAPREVHKVNMNEVKNLKNVKVAGIKIAYKGRKGSVIASAQSVSQSKTQVFRTLLWDILGHKSATGGYPFYIEETSSTKAYVKNGTNRKQNYVSYLIYGDNQTYIIETRELLPNETIEIDVKKLRDGQVPDQHGTVLPTDLSEGQLQWTVRTKKSNKDKRIPDSLGLIGQMTQVDTTKGINSTYFCQNCCPGNTVGYYITPDKTSVDIGEEVQYRAYEIVANCYGNPPATVFLVANHRIMWSVNDSNVGTIDGNGEFTANAAGSVIVTAKYEIEEVFEGAPCPPGGGGGGSFLTSQNKKGSIVKGKKEEIPTSNAAPCDGCESNYLEVTPNDSLVVKPKITIRRDGNDITSTSQNSNIQDVLVGQRMNLSATVEGGSPSSQSWDIPSNSAIKNFVTNSTGRMPSSGNTVALSGLNTNMTDFIWYVGGLASTGVDKEVKFTATVNGVSNTATSKFNIKKPSTSLTTTSSESTRILYDGNTLFGFLILSNSSGTSQGVEFERGTTTIPNGGNGDFQFVQLVNTTITRTSGTTTVPTNWNGLDGCYPYTLDDETASDNPLVGLSSSTVTLDYARFNGQFTLFLMFRPQGMNSSWVSLKKLNWNWDGEARIVPMSNPTQWTANGITEPGSPTSVDTTDFPIWTSIVTDTSDGCTS